MINPIHDRIVLKRVSIEARSKGGLYLGEIEAQSEVGYGIILNVGAGKQVDGTGIIPLTVKKDDLVIFNPMTAKRINLKGEEVYMMRESDVLGTVDPDGISLNDYVTETVEEKKPRMLG